MPEPTSIDRPTREFLVEYYSENPRALIEPVNLSWLFFDDVDRMEKALRSDWFIHHPVADKDGPRLVTLDAQQAFLIPHETFWALLNRQLSLARMLGGLEDKAPAIGIIALPLAIAGAVYLSLDSRSALLVLFWLALLFFGPLFVFGLGLAVTDHICRSRFEALVLRECRKHGEAMPFPRIYALLLAARIEQRRQEEVAKSQAEKLKRRLKNRREAKVFAAAQFGSLAVQVPLIFLGVSGANLAGKAAEKAIELGFKRDEP